MPRPSSFARSWSGGRSWRMSAPSTRGIARSCGFTGIAPGMCSFSKSAGTPTCRRTRFFSPRCSASQEGVTSMSAPAAKSADAPDVDATRTRPASAFFMEPPGGLFCLSARPDRARNIAPMSVARADLAGRITVSPEAVAGFCRRNHIRKLSLFGSVLRDDFRPDSDVDVLVEFEPGKTPDFFDFIGMKEELATMLGRSVDFKTAGSLSPHFRQKVLSEARPLHDAT